MDNRKQAHEPAKPILNTLSPEEDRLLRLLRETYWGEVIVKVKDGRPVMASTIKRDVKLDT